jgi:hypothetical protein
MAGFFSPVFFQNDFFQVSLEAEDFVSPHVYVQVAGVERAYGRPTDSTKILHGSLSVTDIRDEAPNRCSFRAFGWTPSVGDRVLVRLGGVNNPEKIFAGTILTVDQSNIDTPDFKVYDVSATDDTWRLDHHLVIARYTNTPADEIVADLIDTYAPWFSTANVQAGLDIIDEITFTNESLSGALTRLAKRGGYYWYADDLDLHFYLAETGREPDPLEIDHESLNDFTYTLDLSQMVTRVLFEGMGSQTAASAAIGATELSMLDISFASATGGIVAVGPQRITYTGTSVGSTAVGGASTVTAGSSTTIAARPRPAAPTVAAMGAGAFIPAGQYVAGHTFVWADGSESRGSDASNTATVTGSNFIRHTVEVGPAGVTARRIYTYAPGGSTRRFIHEIADNTTTTFDQYFAPTESDPAMPIADASYAAGTSFIYVTQTSIFSATGGAAKVGSIVFTYTGRSVASGIGRLTGIPASGTGAITSTVAPGATVTVGYAAGTTSLPVADTAQFLSGGGSARTGGQTFTYTGRSTSSGAGNLTGIPASGGGSLTAPVGGGAVVEVVYPVGSTSVTVADTAQFSASGTARSGSQTFTYTGRSTSSGVGNLTGIPASGAGSLTAAIVGGDTVSAGTGGTASLIGIPASGAGSIRYAINQGDDVNLVVQEDDTAAQAALEALIDDPAFDGVIEVYLQDRRVSETEARARAQAYLALKSTIEASISYTSRDPKTKAGRAVVVNLQSPTSVTADFIIQTVTIMNFQPAIWPTYRVQASNARFSLEALLRMLRKGGE